MYVCMYLYMYDMYVCMNLCMYVCMNVCIYECMYVRSLTSNVCMYLCMYVCMCLRMYGRVFIEAPGSQRGFFYRSHCKIKWEIEIEKNIFHNTRVNLFRI